MYKLYVHISPSNKLYIGITKRDVWKRWGNYGEGYNVKTTAIGRAIQKYGWDNFQHIVLLDNLSKEVACECEKYLISKYNTTDYRYGYNITGGGEGILGCKRTDETKRKISKANRGRKWSDESKKRLSESLRRNPHVVSEETKRKMSASHKGFRHSEESKQKMRDACVGRVAHKQTPETRAKISKAFKGEKHPFYGKHHSKETWEQIKRTRKENDKIRRAEKWEKNHSHLMPLFEK